MVLYCILLLLYIIYYTYTYILYIIYYIILYLLLLLYYISYTILFCSIPLFLPFLLFYLPPLPILLLISFYTCRHLDILTYTLPFLRSIFSSVLLFSFPFHILLLFPFPSSPILSPSSPPSNPLLLFPPYPLSNPSSSPLPFFCSSLHSRNTCRHLDILIYILSVSNNSDPACFIGVDG